MKKRCAHYQQSYELQSSVVLSDQNGQPLGFRCDSAEAKDNERRME